MLNITVIKQRRLFEMLKKLCSIVIQNDRFRSLNLFDSMITIFNPTIVIRRRNEAFVDKSPM